MFTSNNNVVPFTGRSNVREVPVLSAIEYTNTEYRYMNPEDFPTKDFIYRYGKDQYRINNVGYDGTYTCGSITYLGRDLPRPRYILSWSYSPEAERLWVRSTDPRSKEAIEHYGGLELITKQIIDVMDSLFDMIAWGQLEGLMPIRVADLDDEHTAELFYMNHIPEESLPMHGRTKTGIGHSRRGSVKTLKDRKYFNHPFYLIPNAVRSKATWVGQWFHRRGNYLYVVESKYLTQQQND